MPFEDISPLPGAVPEAPDPSCDETIQSEGMMDMDVSKDLCDTVGKPFHFTRNVGNSRSFSAAGDVYINFSLFLMYEGIGKAWNN